jgi:hypothetical protein
VYDPRGQFSTEERRIADHVVAVEKAGVYHRAADHSRNAVSNPNALVRHQSSDPGRPTELRTLRQPGANAVRDRILKIGEQLTHYGGGDVVIDGRDVKLTENAAREGHTLALRQARHQGQELPRQVRLILADGRILTLKER